MSREITNCHDCDAEPGQPHEVGCDVARCMWTGGQAIACDGGFADIVRQLRADGHPGMADRLAYHLTIDDEDHDCGRDIWTGLWPGIAEAREFGFWCYFRPDYGEGPGWAQVDADHPWATEDLNKVASHCRWDRAAGRWALPSPRLS